MAHWIPNIMQPDCKWKDARLPHLIMIIVRTESIKNAIKESIRYTLISY